MKIKRMLNKHAQFFLLAAVIISAIVISLGIIANQARITKEPKDFYEYGFGVKTETGAVIDFEIYSDVEGNLKDFVERLSKDMKDKDPDLNFLFIYGNNEELIIENYGNQKITASISGTNNLDIVEAALEIKSKVRMGSVTGTEITADLRELIDERFLQKKYTGLNPGDRINLAIEEYSYTFIVSRHQQVIFIVYKEANDEKYISYE
jgi:hypothetical protein